MQLFDYFILVCEYFECRGKHNTESNSVRGTYFLLRDPFLSFLQLHVVYARLEGEVNSGGLYRDVKYQVILRVILSSAAHRAINLVFTKSFE